MKRLLFAMLVSCLLTGTSSLTEAQTGTINGTFQGTVQATGSPTATAFPRSMNLNQRDRAAIDTLKRDLRSVNDGLAALGQKIDANHQQSQNVMAAQQQSNLDLLKPLRDLSPWAWIVLLLLIILLIALIIKTLMQNNHPHRIDHQIKVDLPPVRVEFPVPPTTRRPDLGPTEAAVATGSPVPPSVTPVTESSYTVGRRVFVKTAGVEGVITKAPDELGLMEVTHKDNVVTRVKPMEVELLPDPPVSATPPPTAASSTTSRQSTDEGIDVHVPSSAGNVVVLVMKGDAAEPLFKAVTNITLPPRAEDSAKGPKQDPKRPDTASQRPTRHRPRPDRGERSGKK